MAGNKNYHVDVSIGGQLDGSLQRALNLSQADLLRFQRAINDVNKLSAKASANSYGMNPQVLQQATQQASGFKQQLSNIMNLVPAIGIGGLLVQGFDLAISKAEEFAGFIGNAVKQAADFQTNKAQLSIETGETGKELQDLLDQLQWKANKSPFTMPELSESLRKLVSMGFTTDQALQTLHGEMNMAAATKKPGETYDQHLNQVNDAMAKAVAQGHILERNLYMFEEAGIKIRPFLEKKMGLEAGSLGDLQSDESLDTLRKAIKKGLLDSSTLLEFVKDQTKEGAKYSDAAVAPMIRNFPGATSTFNDMFGQFERALGDPIMRVFTDITNRINDSFSWDKFKAVQEFSQRFSDNFVKAFGPILDSASKTMDWSKLGGDLEKLSNELIALVKASGPFVDFLSWGFPKVVDDLVRLGRAAAVVGTALENAFNFITGHQNDPKLQADMDALRKSGGSTIPSDQAYQDHWNRLNNIGKHAAGGIFDRATLGIIGEAGPEAVLPLDSFKDLVSQQRDLTEAMRDLTDKIGYLGAGTGYGDSPSRAPSGPWDGSLMETAYGYAGDSTPDWNSLHGIGDHNNKLVPYLSAALSQATAERLGLTRHGQTFQFNGKTLRWDDTCPTNGRVDVYSPNHAPDTHVHVHLHAPNVIDHTGMNNVLKTYGARIAEEVRRQNQFLSQRQAVVA